jgi:hypothetical protein
MQNQRFMSGGIFSVAFAFQPPGYSTQRHSFYRIISGGGRLVLHSGDMATFWREVAAASVTSFGAPPRIDSYLHSLFEQRAVVIGHAAAAAAQAAIAADLILRPVSLMYDVAEPSDFVQPCNLCESTEHATRDHAESVEVGICLDLLFSIIMFF